MVGAKTVLRPGSGIPRGRNCEQGSHRDLGELRPSGRSQCSSMARHPAEGQSDILIALPDGFDLAAG
jgi:hypothetical protein